MKQFHLISALSSAAAQACYQPWNRARRQWVRLAARLYGAWCSYFTGAAFPYEPGRIPSGILEQLRRLQWWPDGPSAETSARMQRAERARALGRSQDQLLLELLPPDASEEDLWNLRLLSRTDPTLRAVFARLES